MQNREYHTWMHHLAMNAHSVDAPGMTFFVPAGAGSKAGALGSALKVASTLAAATSAPWYVDGDVTVMRPKERPGASCAANGPFLANASSMCSNATECCPVRPSTRSPTRKHSHTTQLCKYCCGTFAGLCPTNQSRLFDKQTACLWRGSSTANYATAAYDDRLHPASPPSFADWLCTHWHVDVATYLDSYWVRAISCCVILHGHLTSLR